MKKTLLFSLLAFIAFSCQQKTETIADKPVVLSGTVQNAPVPAVVLKDVNNQPVDTLKLDKQGHFADTLKLPEAYYKLSVGPQYTWTYLKPGDQLQINIDFENFDESLSYKGEGAPVNNYLAKKMLTGIALRPKMAYQYYGNLDEKAFVALQDSIENVYDSSLKNISDAQFVALEKFRNKVNKAAMLSRYPMVKAYLMHKPHYQTSEEFPKAFKGVDINDSRFLQIPKGREMVSEYLGYMIAQKQPGKEIDPYQRLQAIDSVLTNPELKEQLAAQEAKYNLMYTQNLEQFYQLFDKIVQNPEVKKPIQEKYNNIKAMTPGAPSPDFTAYDIHGKEYHLKDFAGKPLYIDLWATWCAPCRAEIPYLEKLKEKYKNKPVNFLSLDVYDDKAKWEQMVTKQKMDGWQLISTDREMPFLKKYVVDGIPRFILLDAEGKIIDANAPRPSEKQIEKLIDKAIAKK